MFFQHKEKEEQKPDHDVQNIKNAVSEDKIPEHDKEHYISKKEELPVPTKESGSAPLFVKVDKYHEILKNVQEMKMFLAGSKQLYTILAEIEGIRNDALKVLRGTIQKLERNVTEIDSEFIRPGEMTNPTTQQSPDVRQVEGSLDELQDQLNSLKKELKTLQ